jgi:hypothetical protein
MQIKRWGRSLTWEAELGLLSGLSGGRGLSGGHMRLLSRLSRQWLGRHRLNSRQDILAVAARVKITTRARRARSSISMAGNAVGGQSACQESPAKRSQPNRTNKAHSLPQQRLQDPNRSPRDTGCSCQKRVDCQPRTLPAMLSRKKRSGPGSRETSVKLIRSVKQHKLNKMQTHWSKQNPVTSQHIWGSGRSLNGAEFVKSFGGWGVGARCSAAA